MSWIRNSLYYNDIRLWQDAVKKAPKNARAHNNLGDALRNAGRWSEAQGHFEIAVELSPDYPDALNNLADSYAKVHREKEAIQLLNRALFIDPHHLHARFNIALFYFQKGSNDLAIDNFEWIIINYPYTKEALFSSLMLELLKSGGSVEKK